MPLEGHQQRRQRVSSSAVASTELGIRGDKPVTSNGQLGRDIRSSPADAAAKAAPTAAVGAGQTATTAAAIAAIVENAVIAVKSVVPQDVTCISTAATAEQMAAARKKFGGAGPPGTAKNPATAPNTAAVMPSVNVGNGWAPR